MLSVLRDHPASPPLEPPIVIAEKLRAGFGLTRSMREGIGGLGPCLPPLSPGEGEAGEEGEEGEEGERKAKDKLPGQRCFK